MSYEPKSIFLILIVPFIFAIFFTFPIRAENAIRPFAVGRKNWLFNNTANGALCSAVLYSIIATAQANGIDAEQYLTELFSHPAGTILLPWKD